MGLATLYGGLHGISFSAHCARLLACLESADIVTLPKFRSMSNAGCTALSFGVHCARLAGLDPSVLQRAKQVLGRPTLLAKPSAHVYCRRTLFLCYPLHVLRLL